jgi:hypothetical protein
MKLSGITSPAFAGTIDNVERRAATAVNTLCKSRDKNIVDRRRGLRDRMSFENRKEPMMKLMMEVPDLLHRHGCDAG